MDYIAFMLDNKLITVVEVAEFISVGHKWMDDEERHLLIDFLAGHPFAGDLIPESGGLRKLRWGLEGRGKRGGARVIYYFRDEYMPLFLLTAFAKNAKADLSSADKAAFRQLAGILVDSYLANRRRQ